VIFRGLASLWTSTFFDKFKKSLVYTELIYFRNFAILTIAYLKRNKKHLTVLNHREGCKSFSESIAFSNMKIKTLDNNMVNKVFERTADFRYFDIAISEIIFVYYITHKFNCPIYL